MHFMRFLNQQYHNYNNIVSNSACGSPRVVMYGCSQGVSWSTRKDTKRDLDGLFPVWSLEQTIYHLTDTEKNSFDQMDGQKYISYINNWVINQLIV